MTNFFSIKTTYITASQIKTKTQNKQNKICKFNSVLSNITF